MKNPPKRKIALPGNGPASPSAELRTGGLIETFVEPDGIAPKMVPCVICGSETQTGSPENMCWVCRRLKISAWRDVEQQIPAQE